MFEEFWLRGILQAVTLQEIDWSWLSLDGAMTKAPLGGKKPGPIRRIAAKAASSAAC